ncbi:MAG: hypothetical protein ABI602_02625 [Candidatus Saccharibacteria bacterium]
MQPEHVTRLSDSKGYINYGVARAPLENRIAELSVMSVANDALPVEPTRDQLVRALGEGVGEKWIETTARHIGIVLLKAPDMSARPANRYPALSYELLEEEWAWEQTLRQLPLYVAMNRITRVIGRSENWVKANIESFGVESTKTRSGRNDEVWTRRVMSPLRERRMAARRLGDWNSLEELANSHGETRQQWIAQQLVAAGVMPKVWVSADTGRDRRYYPGEAHSAIELAQQVRLGANSARAIEASIRRAAKKPRSRAKQINMQVGADRRFDNAAQTNQDKLESDDAMVTAHFMAKALGVSQNWIAPRIKGLPTINLPDARGIIRPHYEQKVLQALSIHNKHRPKAAGDMVTARYMMLDLGVSISWLKPRIKGQSTFDRQTDSGQTRLHYSAEVFQEIKALAIAAGKYKPERATTDSEVIKKLSHTSLTVKVELVAINGKLDSRRNLPAQFPDSLPENILRLGRLSA